ncbi:MFS transporter [Burkholderia arboris]|uniref:MFS transporter n=1 Tax=Burkholderia arboris TaxID=488730 RepID=A0ABZ3DVG2_9BURK
MFKPSIVVLFLGTFIIGTCELVVLGLLPDIAAGLVISVPAAGWLITGYALSVALCSPLLATLFNRRLSNRGTLIVLMVIFVLGSIACALSSSYLMLLVARALTALSQGAFFGVGSVVATTLVGNGGAVCAIELMFSCLIVANIVGVPLGTAIGQYTGWRTVFASVAMLGTLVSVGLHVLVPRDDEHSNRVPGGALAQFLNRGMLHSLATTSVFAASIFCFFTYIAPILRGVTGLDAHQVAGVLLLIGLGMTVGGVLGGRLAERGLRNVKIGSFAGLAILTLHFFRLGHDPSAAGAIIFLWAMTGFAAVPVLQASVMNAAVTQRAWVRRSTSAPSTSGMPRAPGSAAS